MSDKADEGLSIVVPCLNERQYVQAFVENILSQECLADGRIYEFLFADGGSEDGTREFIEKTCESDSRVRLIDNPDRTAATGLNRAIRASRYNIVVRMDMHTEYASNYVRSCVEVLEETGAQNVGGAARTKSAGYLQEAICLAYHSWFSVGGALFHNIDYEGNLTTVTYGCWRKQTLTEIGLFDEQFVRNEDDELNLRTVRNGGKILQSRRIKSWYYPRDSIRLLFKQYLQYGYWKVRIIQKHKMAASYRHIVPAVFVTFLLILGIGAAFNRYVAYSFAVVMSAYMSASLGFSLCLCSKLSKLRFLPVLPAVFAAYHFGYGCGFLRGIIDFWLLRRPASASLTELTRRTIGLRPAQAPVRQTRSDARE
jgi:succinoglycan biosynthesis protein ExoA